MQCLTAWNPEAVLLLLLAHGSCFISCKNKISILEYKQIQNWLPTARGATQHGSSLIVCVCVCRASPVMFTAHMRWHRLGSTVDAVGCSAYGRGGVHATAGIPLMSLVLQEKEAAGSTETYPS